MPPCALLRAVPLLLYPQHGVLVRKAAAVLCIQGVRRFALLIMTSACACAPCKPKIALYGHGPVTWTQALAL